MNLLKRFSLFAVVIAFVLTLASCGKISEKYADKINEAAEAGEHYELEKIRKDLGDEAVEVLFLNSGVVVAVKGCESLDDVKAKLDEGKTVKGLLVTIVAGKATAAKYTEITEDDLK